MRYLGWVIKFLVFVILLTLAMQNSEDVALNLFLGQVWHAPLILMLLLFFGAGSALGLFAGFLYSLRVRRELTVLKKEIRSRQQNGERVLKDPSEAIAD